MEPRTKPSKPAPPPPTVNDARVKMEENDTLRLRKGRGANLISTREGRSSGSVTVKNLMGQGGAQA